MNAYNEYKRGRRERLNSPLPYGVYKLCEVVDVLETRAKSAREIAYHWENGLPLPEHALHYTPPEADAWIRDWPGHIAYYLGYKVLPGIDALGGDGVPSNVIKNIRHKYKPIIKDILIKCDETLKSANASDTAHLMERTVETIDAILTEAGHPRREGTRYTD